MENLPQTNQSRARYLGKWVAYSAGVFLGAADTPADLLEHSGVESTEAPQIFKIPHPDEEANPAI